MPMPSSQEAAQKWAKNLGQSTDAIKQGVMRVDVNPAEKAAQKVDKYVQGVQDAASSGKWQAGLRRTTLQSWQDSILKKGLNRVAAGAQAAIPKTQAFMDQFFPYLAAGVARVRNMPDTTLQDRIQRSVEMQLHNSQFRRT